jgi:hypothetical protein
MQWFLFIYLAGASSFQTMGPMPERDMCETAKAQIEKSFPGHRTLFGGFEQTATLACISSAPAPK